MVQLSRPYMTTGKTRALNASVLRAVVAVPGWSPALGVTWWSEGPLGHGGGGGVGGHDPNRWPKASVAGKVTPSSVPCAGDTASQGAWVESLTAPVHCTCWELLPLSAADHRVMREPECKDGHLGEDRPWRHTGPQPPCPPVFPHSPWPSGEDQACVPTAPPSLRLVPWWGQCWASARLCQEYLWV